MIQGDQSSETKLNSLESLKMAPKPHEYDGNKSSNTQKRKVSHFY